MAEQDVLSVIFSMDCLPAGGATDVPGPARWDQAGESPHAFAGALDELGFRATFFVAPEALPRLGGRMEELSEAGCELGLLCHPQLGGYQSYLGSYSYDRQREIIRVGRRSWEDSLGQEPRAFRPGFFSANDYTFHAACMEAFRQGSCSLPGRMDNDQCSMWFEAYPFPHHTDPLDRLSAGTMEFYEVPVTSDFEAAASISYETYTPPHLRIEEPDLHAYAQPLMARWLDWMDEEATEVKVLHLVTSNVVNWAQQEDPHVERLRNLCQALREAAQQWELSVQWSSLEALHQRADRLLGVGLEEEGA